MRYNFEGECFEVMALATVIINGASVEKSQGFIKVNALDQLNFPGEKCYMPHVFFLVMPTAEQ